MPDIYIDPEDLLPSQAARVLNFLNAARSAQQLADDIEYPDEPDIGVKLGQRLLDAREALGGRFTELRQVRAIRLIGPERFTEICGAALGFIPRNITTPKAILLQGQAELQRRIEAVSQQSVQLELKIYPQPEWLGRSLRVRVIARDAAGKVLPNRRVTVQTSDGAVSASYGFAEQQGRAVTVTTGASGSAEVELTQATLEPLTQSQRDALSIELGRLDSASDTPRSQRNAFMGIAQAYQFHGNRALREALDIYARQWKARFFDAVNLPDPDAHWPLETAVIRADAHAKEGSTSVAQAVIVANWKNWVGAWFTYLDEYINQQGGLDQRLQSARSRYGSGPNLARGIVAQAQHFVAAQNGLAAEWVSQRTVRNAMTRFLGNEVATAGTAEDLVAQGNLFAILDVAPEQITRAHPGTIALVSQSEKALDRKIQLGNGIGEAALSEIRTLSSQINAQAQVIDLQFRELGLDQANFNARLNDFNVQMEAFQDRAAQVEGSLQAFDQRAAGVDASLTQAQIQADRVTTQVREIDQKVAHVDAQSRAVDSKISSFNTQVRSVDTKLASFDTKIRSFDTKVRDFDTKYDDFKRVSPTPTPTPRR